jgi:D-alanyl-lipoteichoic acid acyltransferase DltB (MBOAT superfamily)
VTFTEPSFFLFLVIVYSLWSINRHFPAGRMFVLLVASFVFYGDTQWPLVFLLAAYCGVDWAVGRWIEDGARPRRVLAIGVVFNLGILAFWKYTPILAGTFLASQPGQHWSIAALRAGEWIVPFGVSFYSFSGIAYMVDVYRGSARAERNPFRLALHLSFFPHLMAGPILRPAEFLPQLQPGTLPARTAAPLPALLLLGRGMFKKMVLADRIALAIDPFFAAVASPTTDGVWALPYVCLYSLQIYFDFSGYTDIARGLALLFGFRWPENFTRPYLAGSVSEFWRRWHITLSLFLRDYLYIPLGGNRRGRLRTAFNLFLTMLLGGLWHGGSWNFALWGGLHGVLLLAQRAWSSSALAERLAPARWWAVLSVALTFLSVSWCFCFFRVADFAAALRCAGKWFVFDSDKMLVGGARNPSLWLLLAACGVASLRDWAWQGWLRGRVPRPFARGFTWGTALALLVLAVLLAPTGAPPPFIYFQF